MNANIKVGILFLTLAIPVFIYLFLKGFGDNEFTVPVFFSEGIPLDTTDCLLQEGSHLVIPENDFAVLAGENKSVLANHLTVFDIDNGLTVATDPVDPSVQRIIDLSKSFPSVRIFSIRKLRKDGEKINEEIDNIQNGWKVLYVNPDSLNKFGKCQLMLNDFDTEYGEWGKRYVLVDQKGQIRGYYSARDYEEIDRLILEMKIILREEY